MATATKEVNTEETVAKKAAPKAEKKVAAPKVEKKVTTAQKVETKVEETATKVVDSVKETATKVSDSVKETTTSVTNSVKDTATKIADAAKSGIDTVTDAAKSSVDTVKDTYSDVETAISDARVSGNERAKKILTSVFDDNANDKVVDFVGYLGEATAVCSKVMCSPMTVPADKINTLYKKITA